MMRKYNRRYRRRGTRIWGNLGVEWMDSKIGSFCLSLPAALEATIFWPLGSLFRSGMKGKLIILGMILGLGILTRICPVLVGVLVGLVLVAESVFTIYLQKSIRQERERFEAELLRKGGMERSENEKWETANNGREVQQVTNRQTERENRFLKLPMSEIQREYERLVKLYGCGGVEEDLNQMKSVVQDYHEVRKKLGRFFIAK